ncbi:unnamed protein product [Prorocentrum cordatum]|uniref:Ion transport domain-containing protein n=1 Tax=Prorocentrum cordatum TaxID=2364126 RepID=A0ABN9PAM0_9DINO|nr:unnamed protein product [Polarella glacialis]
MVTAVSTVGFVPTGNKQKAKPNTVNSLLNERSFKGGFRSRSHGAPGQVAGPGGAAAGMEQLVASNILDGLAFNCWVTFTVTVNIIVISLEQDLCPSGSSPVDCTSWFLLELLFGMLFLGELAIRIFFTQPKRKFFNDLWNVMDMILIIAAFLDTLVFAPIGIGGFIRYFTVLRALRAIKLVRLVQMFPLFRELWLLVGGLSNSLKALGWVGLIVVMVLYVCGIVVTMEIGKNDDVYAIGPSYDGQVWPYKKYFGTVWRSMFTLFQVLTLDSWCDGIVRHVVYRQPYMGVFFVVFLLLTAFG